MLYGVASAVEYMFEFMVMRPIDKVGSCEREPSLKEVGSQCANLPDEVAVKRSDPVYNAHAYLTKIPVTAIEPFLEAFTKPGDLVLDMYGGSGMTGVAAAMQGRRAEIRDISALGQHVGSNYLNLVEEDVLRAAAKGAIDEARKQLGDIYATRCANCDEVATLSRTVWTYIYECQRCRAPVNYYEALKASGWSKKGMKCRSCNVVFSARHSQRIAEEPVLDTIACACSAKLRDCEHLDSRHAFSMEGVSYPDVAIAEDRQMFQSSALKKHGLVTTAAFFSKRNLAALAVLRQAIEEVEDKSIRSKLLFAFTGVLTRASKRYQWHPKRPLNAANQNYYIAPVFYEWNVYDLFERKIEAALRSDRYIRERMAAAGIPDAGQVNYVTGSADEIDLPDESVDYVFTDPPFGSNIFYSDMNLFQEVWIGSFTDDSQEAVVDRSSNGGKPRTPERYERLITDSLKEAHRVLRTDGWLSLVFSNSNGQMWALLQRAIVNSGLSLEEVTLLNKGQRSVKGLASGFEKVVTVDLVLSMQKTKGGSAKHPGRAPAGSLESVVTRILTTEDVSTPSHLYLKVIRHYLRQNWDVTDLDIGAVNTLALRARYDVDATSGRLVRAVAA